MTRGGMLVYSENSGCIGRHDASLTAFANYFEGAMDDFRYWDRELTIAEVALLSNEEDMLVRQYAEDKTRLKYIQIQPGDWSMY